MNPVASNALLFKRFVDDIIESNSTKQGLMDTKRETDELIGMFGFKIKEWYSNMRDLGAQLKSKKILGIQYDTENDELSVKIEPLRKKDLTKRRILSRIAEIWDPVGITAGVCLTGKLLFQSITRLNYSWDELIENEDLKKMCESGIWN